jgi:hypothetical protein
MTWIKISESPPTKQECAKDHGWFLVYREYYERIELSRYDGYDDPIYKQGWKYPYDDKITHWMPLPDKPKEEDALHVLV